MMPEPTRIEVRVEIWGTEFKVIVNSQERAKAPRYSVSVRGCWAKYQHQMANEIHCTNDVDSLKRCEAQIPALIIQNDARPKQLLADIKNLNLKVVLAILPFPPKKEKDHLNALLQAGVPIILWTRNSESSLMLTNNMENCFFCHQKLIELPDCVYKQRNKAYASDELSHIGKHLTLLWDDPTFCINEQTPFTPVKKR